MVAAIQQGARCCRVVQELEQARRVKIGQAWLSWQQSLLSGSPLYQPTHASTAHQTVQHGVSQQPRTDDSAPDHSARPDKANWFRAALQARAQAAAGQPEAAPAKARSRRKPPPDASEPSAASSRAGKTKPRERKQQTARVRPDRWQALPAESAQTSNHAEEGENTDLDAYFPGGMAAMGIEGDVPDEVRDDLFGISNAISNGAKDGEDTAQEESEEDLDDLNDIYSD